MSFKAKVLEMRVRRLADLWERSVWGAFGKRAYAFNYRLDLKSQKNWPLLVRLDEKLQKHGIFPEPYVEAVVRRGNVPPRLKIFPVRNLGSDSNLALFLRLQAENFSPGKSQTRYAAVERSVLGAAAHLISYAPPAMSRLVRESTEGLGVTPWYSLVCPNHREFFDRGFFAERRERVSSLQTRGWNLQPLEDSVESEWRRSGIPEESPGDVDFLAELLGEQFDVG